MARLRTARLTNDTLLSQIDDYVGELESDVAEILGVTLDTDVTESALGLSNAGLVTKALLRFYAASDAPERDDGVITGVSVENSTNSNVILAGLFKYILTGVVTFGVNQTDPANNAVPGLEFVVGSEGDNASGYWAINGHRYDNTTPGLLPDGFTANYYWGTDGALHIPGRPSESCLLAGASTAGNTGAPVVPAFSAELFDDEALHAANDDEIIIVNAGNYIVGWSISFEVGSGFGRAQDAHATVALKRDRSAVVTTWAQADQELMADIAGNFQGQALVPCNAADKLSLSCNVTKNSGSDTYHIDGTFWAARVT